MISTTEVFTDNSPISPMKSSPFKKTSALKSQCRFTNNLEVKKLLIVGLMLLNIRAWQLNLKINHGHFLKSEKVVQKSTNR